MEQLEFDIIDLGASRIEDGSALWQGTARLSSDDEDREPLGEGEAFQSLGVTSMPYPEDENGKAEGLCVRDIAGRNTVYLGARDTRSASIVGRMKPGDTVVHSTGPQQAAQLQLKEEKRQAALVSKNSSGKTMVFLLDGEADKAQIILAGMAFEMNAKDKSVTLTNGKASILMQGRTIALDGDVILGGTRPDSANKIMTSTMVAPAPVPVAVGAPGAGVTYTVAAAAAKGVSLAV